MTVARRSSAQSRPLLSLVVRLWWSFFGVAASVFVLARVAFNSRGELSWLDLLYGAFAVSLALVRFVDVRFLGGDTAEGDRPATLADAGRYTMYVLGGGALAWVAVRAATGWF